MTYRELDYKATRLLDNAEITLGEYEKMTKPLDREIEQEPILNKIFGIVHPLSIMSTPELEHKAIMQIAEMLEPLRLPESEDKE